MIELKNITKKYGKSTVIEDMSFKIEKGEIVGFLGQNGAGKTTTMKMIVGLLKPTDGKIYIDSELLSRKSRKKIGYMPENIPLYNELTVKEFIDFMCELKGLNKVERKAETENLIKKLNLKDVENKLIKNISRGYKQRVSLAGALVGNPEILILDEPTVGLDPKQIVDIRNLIKDLKKDHTVILSSHILTEVSQICQKVMIIDKGKIIAIDTPQNLENKINKNSIIVVVNDADDKMLKIKDQIKNIEDIKLKNNIDKNTKEYEIFVNDENDVRAKLFEILPKEGINILELKNSEANLEDAFINLIEEGGNTDVGSV